MPHRQHDGSTGIGGRGGLLSFHSYDHVATAVSDVDGGGGLNEVDMIVLVEEGGVARESAEEFEFLGQSSSVDSTLSLLSWSSSFKSPGVPCSLSYSTSSR